MSSKDAVMISILDASGSMNSVRQATIDAYNQFFNEQRDQPGQAYLFLTLFNTYFENRFMGTPLEAVPDLGTPGNQYVPGGGTALLDAVGTSIKSAEAWLAGHPEFDGRVFVVITTDGQENASKTWHNYIPMQANDDKDVSGLIRWKQSEGWDFVFLGSGSDWLERNFGHVIADHRKFVTYAGDALSTTGTYAGVSSAMTSARQRGTDFIVTPNSGTSTDINLTPPETSSQP